MWKEKLQVLKQKILPCLNYIMRSPNLSRKQSNKFSLFEEPSTVLGHVVTDIPMAFAAEGDNTASKVEIKIGAVYNVYDNGTSKIWCQ